MFGIFKKKKAGPPEAPRFETVLCIPGKWASHQELVLAIAQHTDGKYLFAGGVLMDTASKTGFVLQEEPANPQMRSSFQAAGYATGLTEPFLDEVGNHLSVVYLMGETGSFEKASAICQAASALLQAGGLGVKVETAGKAFMPAQWQEILGHNSPEALHHLLVVDAIGSGNGTVFSCGMHNLGLPDAIATGSGAEVLSNLLFVFNAYQVMESPVIEAGQTFSTAPNAPVFRISRAKKQPYEGDELFFNPFGMWELSPV